MEDYKKEIAHLLSKYIKCSKENIVQLIEVPKDPSLGDYAFPCFILAKHLKKSPGDIAQDLSTKISLSPEFESVKAAGPYLNFFVNKNFLTQSTLERIQKEKDKYGSQNIGRNKSIVVEFSSPNIAKPFGIGHLRSTIIGNSLTQIYNFLGYKTVKLNYLGDWGTPFGKIIAGYEKFGSEKELKKDPMKHLYDIYVKTSQKKEYDDLGREYFNRLENNDKSLFSLWKKFRDLSIKEFNKVYSLIGISFDLISGESEHQKDLDTTLKLLQKRKLIKESEGALIVDLEKYNLGVCLIKKSDGATLYATRDIAAAISRYNRYKFDKMIYEVGSEQSLHLKQVFKILELLGFSWAKSCVHVDHGLYLDEDGKKFSTRKGKTVFMEDILKETQKLAKKEITKREKLSIKELEKRALIIARAAIFYGDLKNFRSHDMVFDIDRFVSFEGDTGPYLLYAYARSQSILRKAKSKKSQFNIPAKLSDVEKELIINLSSFPQVVEHAAKNNDPSEIAKYSYKISQLFNEFYHSSQVIGSEEEPFRLSLVSSFAQVLKNALSLLGISVIEKM